MTHNTLTDAFLKVYCCYKVQATAFSVRIDASKPPSFTSHLRHITSLYSLTLDLELLVRAWKF